MLYRRKHKRPDGKVVRSPIWSYHFRYRGKGYHGSTEETLKERAREAESKKREEVRRGRLTVVRDVTFEFLSTEYLRLHAERKKAKKFFEWTVAILKGNFGTTLLSQIGPKGVEEFLAARRANRKISTANRSLTILKHRFRKAEEWGYLARGTNPAAGFKTEKEKNGREFFLTADQAETFLGKIADRYKPLVLTALHTGARRGELLGLSWEDVDLDRRLLTFRNTKNGENRTVPMSETLSSALRRMPGRLQGGHVFRTAEGEPLEPAGFRKAFEGAVKNVGLKGFRFHDLRHSAASFMVQAGVPLNTVRAILGHKSLTMTLPVCAPRTGSPPGRSGGHGPSAHYRSGDWHQDRHQQRRQKPTGSSLVPGWCCPGADPDEEPGAQEIFSCGPQHRIADLDRG